MDNILNWLACLFLGHSAPDLTKMEIWNMNSGRGIPTQKCFRCRQARRPIKGTNEFEWGKWRWEDDE